jgi:Zn ribbon nucleic-acid-binding protein
MPDSLASRHAAALGRPLTTLEQASLDECQRNIEQREAWHQAWQLELSPWKRRAMAVPPLLCLGCGSEAKEFFAAVPLCPDCVAIEKRGALWADEECERVEAIECDATNQNETTPGVIP